jgi:lysophospholipase L1-like esterase
VTLVGFMSASAAGASHADGARGVYVALGDSLTFGYSPLLEDPWVPDRFVGYPELIEQRTGLTTTNFACPGQTAQALVSRTAVDNGCFDFRDFAREEGIGVLHADYDGTQLDAALAAVRSSAPPSLISIQGGGNDTTICAFDAPDPEQCFADTLPKVTDTLREAVRQLQAAGYWGRIVLVGYHLVPGLEDELRAMNRAIERAAGDRGVVFADAAHLFERYARRHGGDLCSSGLLVVLPDGSCDLHPSPVGQELVADAVLDAAFGHGHHQGGCHHSHGQGNDDGRHSWRRDGHGWHHSD